MEEPKTEPTLSKAKHMVYSRSQAEKTELVVAPYESLEYAFCPVKIYADQQIKLLIAAFANSRPAVNTALASLALANPNRRQAFSK